MIDFFPEEHKTVSSKKRFGICDETPPPNKKAYIDEANGQNWIAIVENFYEDEISFIPVDNCIDLRRPDNKQDNRCDGLIYYNKTIIFVELKTSVSKSRYWIDDGEKQLRVTIGHFEKCFEAKGFEVKKAYISNRAKPQFRRSMAERMENFFYDTGYVLRIENRINLLQQQD